MKVLNRTGHLLYILGMLGIFYYIRKTDCWPYTVVFCQYACQWTGTRFVTLKPKICFYASHSFYFCT
jgi:hypothetical protein